MHPARLVTTNTMFNEKCMFLDEKVWKPIYNHHPFIFVGCSNLGNGSLKELRRQGFKTFHPYIDERYDKQGHPTKRILMIADEIERLCSYTLKEMENWYEQLIPRLEHNHETLFENKGFNSSISLPFLTRARDQIFFNQHPKTDEGEFVFEDAWEIPMDESVIRNHVLIEIYDSEVLSKVVEKADIDDSGSSFFF